MSLIYCSYLKGIHHKRGGRYYLTGYTRIYPGTDIGIDQEYVEMMAGFKRDNWSVVLDMKIQRDQEEMYKKFGF